MDKTYSIAEARDSLAALVHEAESGHPVKLTRRGKSVAVIVSETEYQRLQPKKTNFWEAVKKFRATHNLTEDPFTDADFEGLRDKSPGREFSWDN